MDGTNAITDFLSGTDRFFFLQANFGGLASVDNSNFSTVSGAYANNGAHAGPSFIFADTAGSGGTLIFDADGNGAGAGYEVATITGDTLTAADIDIGAQPF